METRIIKAILLVFFIPLMVSGQFAGESVLSLKTCIQLSFSNNLKLRLAQMETRKNHYQLKEAISSGLPQINSFALFDDYFNIPVYMISGEILGQPGTMIPVQFGSKYYANVGIQAGQMIYNASYLASIRLFKKACEISNLNVEQNKEELVYMVAQIYLFIQTASKQLSLIDSNLIAFRKIHDYSGLHYKNGLIRKADLDRVTVAINNIETERDNLLLTRNQQLNMLKYLAGIEQGRKIVLADDFDIINFPHGSPDTTFRNQIDMKLLEQKQELAIINLKLAQAGHIPSLSGYAGFSYQAPVEKFSEIDNKDNWYKTSYVGIKLTVPIFEGNRIRSRMNQSKTELDQIKTSKADLRNELFVKLKNASEKLNTNKELEAILRVNMELAGNVFKVTNQHYREGLKSITDVLNAQSEYNTSALLWLNSLLRIKLSELEILKLSGTINTLSL